MSRLADSLSASISHVFHWPAKYQIRLLLPTMLGMSLALHLAGLYLIRTPAPFHLKTPPPASKKITVLSPDESSLLLATQDPSWMMPGRYRTRLLQSPRAIRNRSALNPELPPLASAPEPSEATTWLPSLPPLNEVARFESGKKSPPPNLAPLTARLDREGPSITEDVLSRLQAVAPTQPPSAATELIIAIDAGGETRHVWPIRSSGVQALDLAARRALQLAHFGPSENGFRGILRINWGTTTKNPNQKP